MQNTYKFQRTYTSKKEGHKVGTVVEKADRWEAEKKFYNTIGADMDNDDIIEEEVIVWTFNENGDIEIPFSKKWSAPTVE
ncbi:MAG: hypothetical protein KBT27_14810 [Prevotellaceae bacterium]|nr:hypothetical protein [Candidatus Faecinaster equi]